MSADRLLLLRLSAELTTKSRGTRRRFMKRLVENLRDALRETGEPARLESLWTRVLVRTAAPGAAEVLTRVAGLSSVSTVEATAPAELERIVAVGRDTFAERVRGVRFAVRARRVGTHPFSSFDVQRALGTALNPGARVDLVHPEVEVQVEIRDRDAYFFADRTPGLGGLPLGVEGRAVCLISGGFDSAVAAWLMLKRGVELDYVFCNLAGGAYERSVVQVAQVLARRWSYGSSPRFHVLDFGACVDELRERTQPKFWQLILKRLMYRAAAAVARARDARGVVTGESIGQVSSQTLANLGAIDGAVDLPVLRPLLGFDKAEIIARARQIGTYDLSSRVREYCSIAPGNPVTHARAEVVAAEERKLDPAVLDRALASQRVLELRAVGAADLIERYLFIEAPPAGSRWVDARDEEAWREWHAPGAVRISPWEVDQRVRELDPGGSYVVYCDGGTQAAVVAEQLQRAGLEAYALRGGSRALRAATERGFA